MSLDLIYGTPGESLADWETSIEAALGLRARPRLGVLPDRRARARPWPGGSRAASCRRPTRTTWPTSTSSPTSASATPGCGWYEVSNWARDAAPRCRHNELYWTGGHWWGVGPGAHSHVGGVRWWNVKHPAAYAGRLAEPASPAAARETLDAETRRVERVLLEIRLRDGLPVLALDAHGRAAVAGLVAAGPGRAGRPSGWS